MDRSDGFDQSDIRATAKEWHFNIHQRCRERASLIFVVFTRSLPLDQLSRPLARPTLLATRVDNKRNIASCPSISRTQQKNMWNASRNAAHRYSSSLSSSCPHASRSPPQFDTSPKSSTAFLLPAFRKGICTHRATGSFVGTHRSSHSFSRGRNVGIPSDVRKRGPVPIGCSRVHTYATAGGGERRLPEGERLLVVGSGVAGCSAALIAAERHRIPVTLLFAGSAPTDCNSYWAQGGIIYRNYDPRANDSAESLVADVHRAGAGLCEDDAVWKLASEGPDRVRELLLGGGRDGKFAKVPFDRNERGELSCCLEASHSAPRIIHFSDCTGKAITEHITAAAVNHPLITVVADSIVTDLLTVPVEGADRVCHGSDICMGARVLNTKTLETHTLYATRGTLLASGGLAGVYEHSTNPAGFNALGSSVALATRASARTSDLEYVQFHPTSLFIPNESRFLLTEALRGEGAVLRDASGRAFARDFHIDGELAPRDIVARGVFNESQKSSGTHHNVFLDITHRNAKWLTGRFPSIDAHLRKHGLDITTDHLPVIPAAHYTCGGVTTDLDGRTNILNLYSAGEAARTGLHGGNRLASTSLLEGLVYGASVADFVGTKGRDVYDMAREVIDSSRRVGTRENDKVRIYEEATSAPNCQKHQNAEQATFLLAKLRRIMWDNVGVVRTPAGLYEAVSVLGDIREEACHLYHENMTMETAGLRDAAFAGEAVAMAALANRVSAGAHCIILDGAEAAKAQQSLVVEDDSDTDDEGGQVAGAAN